MEVEKNTVISYLVNLTLKAKSSHERQMVRSNEQVPENVFKTKAIHSQFLKISLTHVNLETCAQKLIN